MGDSAEYLRASLLLALIRMSKTVRYVDVEERANPSFRGP